MVQILAHTCRTWQSTCGVCHLFPAWWRSSHPRAFYVCILMQKLRLLFQWGFAEGAGIPFCRCKEHVCCHVQGPREHVTKKATSSRDGVFVYKARGWSMAFQPAVFFTSSPLGRTAESRLLEVAAELLSSISGVWTLDIHITYWHSGIFCFWGLAHLCSGASWSEPKNTHRYTYIYISLCLRVDVWGQASGIHVSFDVAVSLRRSTQLPLDVATTRTYLFLLEQWQVVSSCFGTEAARMSCAEVVLLSISSFCCEQGEYCIRHFCQEICGRDSGQLHIGHQSDRAKGKNLTLGFIS